MLKVVVTAAAAFAATNIDDLFVLMLLFGQAGQAAERRRIVAGQYVGVGLLTATSLAGALGVGLFPEGLLRLLGLVPIALGIRAWLKRDGGEDAENSALSVPGVAALTVANGGDNIGVYLPLLAQMDREEKAAALVIFAFLCGLWCAVGARLAELPVVARAIARHRNWLVPLVLILLGASILLSV